MTYCDFCKREYKNIAKHNKTKKHLKAIELYEDKNKLFCNDDILNIIMGYKEDLEKSDKFYTYNEHAYRTQLQEAPGILIYHIEKVWKERDRTYYTIFKRDLCDNSRKLYETIYATDKEPNIYKLRYYPKVIFYRTDDEDFIWHILKRTGSVSGYVFNRTFNCELYLKTTPQPQPPFSHEHFRYEMLKRNVELNTERKIWREL